MWTNERTRERARARGIRDEWKRTEEKYGSKRRNWISNPLSDAKLDAEDYGKYRGLILATVPFSSGYLLTRCESISFWCTFGPLLRNEPDERDVRRRRDERWKTCMSFWYLWFCRQFWDTRFFVCPPNVIKPTYDVFALRDLIFEGLFSGFSDLFRAFFF